MSHYWKDVALFSAVNGVSTYFSTMSAHPSYTTAQNMMVAAPDAWVYGLAIPIAMGLERHYRPASVQGSSIMSMTRTIAAIGAGVVFSSYVTEPIRNDLKMRFDLQNGVTTPQQTQVVEPAINAFDTNIQDTLATKPHRMAFPVARLTQ